MWGVFEAGVGNVERGRKLLKIGHALNPRDPVLLQSLGLLEYKHSSANLARALLRRASELDPRHQPVWIVSLQDSNSLVYMFSVRFELKIFAVFLVILSSTET